MTATVEDIVLCVFAAAIYWGICQLFTAYDRRCLSRRLYVTVRSKRLWLLLGGRYRGGRRIPEEDWYKLSIMGLAAYIALLPVLLAVCAAIWGRYVFDAHSGIALASYGFAVVLLNVLDEILGNMFWKN